MDLKIAVVTEDHKHISSHFGMAPFYQVYSVVDGQIVSEEARAKPHHSHHPGQGHAQHGHADMFAPIADCKVLLCGGMGTPAYKKAQESGLEVVLTGGELRQAVQAYLDGQVTSDLRRVHQH